MKILEESTWKNYDKKPTFEPLKKDSTSEVVIIGGGLTGISTAYLLAKEGKKVTVLEMDKIGGSTTAYTTAFITQDIDTDVQDLVKMFGEKEAKQVWQSHGQAIDLIKNIVNEEKLDCEFQRCSAFVYTISEDGVKGLREEQEAAKKIGVDLTLHEDNPFAFKNYGSLENKNQAKFHPLKYLFQLAEVVKKMGVEIYENSEVVSMNPEGKNWAVYTKDGNKITAQNLVIATYSPFGNPKPTHFKKGMYASYVFEMAIPRGAIPENIYWDDDNPYNYFRVDHLGAEVDRVILGGQDHRKEIKLDAEKNFKALEDYARDIFSGIDFKITRKWSGPILEPSDGLALIGQTYPGQYVATAFSGNGMTYAHVSAILLTDLIMARENAWQSIYDPARVPSLYQLAKKGKDYAEEFFGGAMDNLFKRPKTST